MRKKFKSTVGKINNCDLRS